MLQSGLTKQFIEADILLFVKPKRVFVTRCSELTVGYVCQFSVGIHNIGKKRVATWERPPASQSEDLCRTKCSLSDKGTARCFFAETKSASEIFCENFEKPPLRRPRTGLSRLQYYNRPGTKTSPQCGLERS